MAYLYSKGNRLFGDLEFDGDRISSFKEKSQLHEGWINGGFFVCEPSFIDTIDNDETILERDPLENAAKQNQLMAYKHEGFWQCMDTKRDKDLLEELWHNKKAPWKV